ncbi:Glycerate dehydrogenase [Sinobacterium norvegicum]|uniref:Glycerate dehydrogenase n=1 Tax=Sinobacterium norvegicum TaxID=1641715 RepID=A0ABN8EHK2_9GAMM|nr:D-2-hydroxyacid dehydrogenase [Sinobacterium norvegicum]CAH0990822.1 Glycerate dehydrogenase [Sinobacterium norvegicum]
MIKAVVLDADTLVPEQLDLTGLSDLEGVEWQWYAATQPQECAERIADADIVLTNKVGIGEAEIAAAPRLKYIAVMATGTNVIDILAAKQRGVVVSNIVGYSAPSLMQHTMMMLLALAGKLLPTNAQIGRGEWQRAEHFCLLDFPAVELAGKTLGLIGLGVTAKSVAAMAEAFEMKVMVAQRPGSNICPAGRVPLAQLLSEADFISIHCPLTEATKGLIAASQLQQMKSTAYIINTARGGIIEEQALADALRAGEIAGAAVDVLTVEPPTAGNPLLAADIPNLIVTPHSGWGSIESRQRMVDQLVRVVAGFIAAEPINIVVS